MSPASWLEAFAVVTIVVVTAWSLLAARKRIRGQEPARIELVPVQPGDARAPAPGRRASVDAARLRAWAPSELTTLEKRVEAAASSPEAREALTDRLRVIAGSRAVRAGRRIGVDATVDPVARLAEPTGLRSVLMRIPGYRSRMTARAVETAITAIEEFEEPWR